MAFASADGKVVIAVLRRRDTASARLDNNAFELVVCPTVRPLCITFAAYLTLLACLPCADATVMLEHERVTLAEDGHDHPDGEDHCSPLCACACCGVVSVAPPAPVTLPTEATLAPEAAMPVAVTCTLVSVSAPPDGQPPRQ